MTMSSLNILIDSNSLQQRIIALMEEYVVQFYRSPLQDFNSDFMTDTITDTTYLPTMDISTEIPRDKIVVVYVNPQSRKFAEDFHAYLQQRLFKKSIIEEDETVLYPLNLTERNIFYVSDCDRSKVQGTNVILLHNIIENEQSIAEYEETIRLSSPNSICSITLLCPYNLECKADFIGFTIPVDRIVGYGLSWKGHFQQLFHISTIS